ncbi:hypothetical protein [uncultured Gammaproteobacteria bacterium]|uniref:Uncharacterized protein n=1 Tax=Bathymodiolus azoricus thioautotrophic gill symbiont TaxID=235205 RepID=A0ACA8ZRR2_9GAMM|nr:hypothetical protein AZO1586R_1827 [Bathymodiolus azoricus thioautotrophic gill symbiont]CAC9540509.1 hypothetical protein [uncultured Gammaproteobacteria bacterium]CAC9547253.1 hypothetical protein [uncultured Gammaproteobacteria bacterium]CAC9985643.1 hypothetical protein [uncultured Gammaproteobacteria bacterium]
MAKWVVLVWLGWVFKGRLIKNWVLDFFKNHLNSMYLCS